MKATLSIAMTVVLLAGVAFAQDDIRHPAARKALIRAEQDIRKAEQVYQQAMIRIQRELIRELESAKSDAMQRQLLDEANRIQQAIDSAKVELDRLEGKPVVQTFTIDAAKDWQPTIEVRKGQRVEVRARGTWSAAKGKADFTTGPDGGRHPRTGEHSFYLEGRVGTQVIPLGSNRSFSAPEDGVFEMRQSETGSRDDNDGALTVSVAAS